MSIISVAEIKKTVSKATEKLQVTISEPPQACTISYIASHCTGDIHCTIFVGKNLRMRITETTPTSSDLLLDAEYIYAEDKWSLNKQGLPMYYVIQICRMEVVGDLAMTWRGVAS